MGHNLFIFYELNAANIADVERAVKSLGNSTPIFSGVWYVNGIENAEEAIKRISSWMTDKDHLLVVDSASDIALWYNLDEVTAQRIRQNWRMDISKGTQNNIPQLEQEKGAKPESKSPVSEEPQVESNSNKDKDIKH